MNSLPKILLFTFVLAVSSCSSTGRIIDRPITFDTTREQLSLEYMREHYGIEKAKAEIDPKMVVVHWTVIPTLERSFAAFNPSELPGHRTAIKNAGNLNVSAHFLVDRDGTVYQLLPETTFARHVIGLNHCAIGIENVADGKELPLTEKQFEANVKLINHLAEKYPLEYLIGHDQYKQFIGHPLWKEKDANYLTEKTDVGPEFIQKLHYSIDKKLKPAPGL
ncbi:N-acetylmuramoyl-L-alanine amidase [Fulvivirga sp. M361]|uniref:peptidoglycan recognition protein family protein n=1 Tax=Fulvivirga sp. M361 TaxID=2594266 RepID=UPI00117AC928|nr:peptidoglycan recognition family protein [Fulvivirga sp. M361]TRX53014.1 N-acetylmuramoyl-L-alanine amidase [Fulvivirga sp. M361]